MGFFALGFYGAFYKQNFLSFYVAGFHTPPFSSIPHFPTATPPPIPGMSGDLSASVAPRGGAFVLANMTNPHLSPPSPVGGVVGHNIDRRITVGN